MSLRMIGEGVVEVFVEQVDYEYDEEVEKILDTDLTIEDKVEAIKARLVDIAYNMVREEKFILSDTEFTDYEYNERLIQNFVEDREEDF